MDETLVALARRVTRAWDRWASCLDEFPPAEYPGTCGEDLDALDTAILELMRVADPERWERRQAMMWEAAEQAIRAAGPGTAPEGEGC